MAVCSVDLGDGHSVWLGDLANVVVSRGRVGDVLRNHVEQGAVHDVTATSNTQSNCPHLYTIPTDQVKVLNQVHFTLPGHCGRTL